MISVIITSRQEPKTIGKCIRSIGDQDYSGIRKPFEIIQLSPDIETLAAGKMAADDLNLSASEYIQIQDPKKGKPYALNMALKHAKGDILIFTDGDTFFNQSSVHHLLQPFENESIGGVSGRPVSIDEKDNMMGYWGHLLSDAAHDRRIKRMEKSAKDYYISNTTFFPMSGYIMASRNFKMDLPSNVLSDDAYISYWIRNANKQIAYTPLAKCFVKYPTTLKDYYKQKVRSIGGYMQLEKMGVQKKDKQSRSLFIELKYTFFVFKYATTTKELFWSLLLFPVRLITWLKIYWERVLLKKDMPQDGWERIESTK